MCGVRGRALSHPQVPALWAGWRGPLPTGCWCGGAAGVGTRHQPHSARSCMLCGRHEGARGGRLLPGCGASGVGRSPTPNCPPSGWAAGAHYPLAVGAGGRGRGDPSPTPQRALLRAGFARCGGGTRAPRGGTSCLGVGRPGSGAPRPRLPALWAGCWGPLPTGCGCGGGAGVGARHQPHSARSCELALRAVGAAGGRPGGALPAWVCGVRGRVLSHPRLPALWAGCRGPLPTGCWCGGVRAWGPVTNPTARTLAWCGGGMRVPGGGASCLGVGRPGSGALPPPTAHPLGGLPGPTTHWLWVRGAAGVGTRHQPHSARSCALWGRHEGARGGRLLPGCGASGVGRSPIPDCPPSGRAAGAHYPLAVGAGGCGRGNPSPTPQRPLLRAGFARCGGGMRVPGGGASCLGLGCPGSGALPTPTARPLGGLPGPTTNWLWVRGAAGVGTRHQPHSARSCALWGRHEGARGLRLLPGCGASGVGRSPIPDCPPSGRAAGAHYPLAVGAGGCGRGDPSPTPQRALLRAGFARCGGGRRAPGGGCLLPGCGASGVRRSPTPDCPPSWRAAGARYPLAVGAGGCGRWDPSPTPQRALLRGVGAA